MATETETPAQRRRRLRIDNGPARRREEQRRLVVYYRNRGMDAAGIAQRTGLPREEIEAVFAREHEETLRRIAVLRGEGYPPREIARVLSLSVERVMGLPP